MKRQGGATPTQIKGLARQKKVAQKTILELINTLGLQVLKEVPPPKPKERDRLFSPVPSVSPPSPQVRVGQPPQSEAPCLEDLIEIEAELRAEQERTLSYLVQVEQEAKTMREEAEKERERAKKYFDYSVELRKQTKADREKIETLSGDLSALTRKYNRMAGKAKWLYGELSESVEREKKLLEALRHAVPKSD